MSASDNRPKPNDCDRRMRRLEAQTRRLRRAREALLGVQHASTAVASCLDPREALQEIVSKALEVVDGDAAAVFLLNEQTNRLEPHGAAGAIGPDPPRALASLSARSRGWKELCKRGGLIIDNAENSPYLGDSRRYVIRVGGKSVIATTLMARGKVIGAIAVSSRRRKRAFRRSELDVLRLFADQAALALDNSHLYRQATEWSARVTSQLELGKAMVDGIRDPVALLDAADRVAFANRALFAVLGREPRQVLGRSWDKFLDPADAAAVRTQAEAAPGKVISCPVHIIRPDGSRVPVVVNAGESHDTSGRLVGTLAVVTGSEHDGSASSKLADSYRVVSAVGHLAGAASRAFDVRGLAAYALRAATDLVGVDIGVLYLVDGDDFVLVASQGLDSGIVERASRWRIRGSASARALAARKPFLFTDLRRLRRLSPRLHALLPADVRSGVVMPLSGREAPIGVLTLAGPDPKPFTHEALSTLSILAGQFGTAIENTRLFAAAQQRAERLAALNQAAEQLLACSNLEQVVSILSHGIARALDARRVVCLDYDWDKKVLVPIAGHGATARLIKRLPAIKLGDAPLVAMSVSERKPVWAADAAKAEALPPEYCEALGAGSVVSVPVAGRHLLHGVVLADNCGRPLSVSDEQQDMAMALANQSATTLENLFLLREEQERSQQLSLAVQEAHHRIKNNLQSVCDLLELELMQPGTTSTERIEHSIQRVRAISLVHDFLSRHHDVATVDARQVLERLVPLVVASNNGGEEQQVEAVLRCDPIVLTSKQSTALALIVNELVSNAVRHGLNGGRKGKVEIDLRETGGRVRLIVSDNGHGLPEGFAGRAGAHVGLEIARVLAERDLSGTFRIGSRGTRRRGTVARVVFSKR
jgi:PAS domain S-box-containing protein